MSKSCYYKNVLGWMPVCPDKECEDCRWYVEEKTDNLKGRRMTDAESMEMLFDDALNVPYDAISEVMPNE